MKTILTILIIILAIEFTYLTIFHLILPRKNILLTGEIMNIACDYHGIDEFIYKRNSRENMVDAAYFIRNGIKCKVFSKDFINYYRELTNGNNK